MDKEIKIRKVNLEDFGELLSLLNQLSPISKEEKIYLKESINILKEIIKDKCHYLCVVEQNNSLIGTGTLLIQKNLSHAGKPYAHIENIVVDSSQRGKGIGKQIVLHLIEKAKESKCYKVILDCKKENIPFYNKCGMSETGEVEMRINLN